LSKEAGMLTPSTVMFILKVSHLGTFYLVTGNITGGAAFIHDFDLRSTWAALKKRETLFNVDSVADAIQ
jgi:hypothetical protein